MGTFATSVYPIFFFYLFAAVRWNLLCIILRDFDFAAESRATEAAFKMTFVASCVRAIIFSRGGGLAR